MTETLCTTDEKVLLNTPAYGYFLHAAEYAGVDVLTSPLHKKADGTFEWTYEDFEQQVRRSGVQAGILVQSRTIPPAACGRRRSCAGLLRSSKSITSGWCPTRSTAT
ncbi:MAG: hypothetical protein ACLUNO_02935 [Oscillospiraceae bacterium]